MALAQPAGLAGEDGAQPEEEFQVDLGNLAVTQLSLKQEPGVLDGNPDAIKSMATRLAQELMTKLFSLPSAGSIPDGKLVELPAALEPLPRAKPIPQPKPLTKWEKFAKEKGIVKKKRSKLVWDETTQDWKRRHGYGKANDELAVPIIEASDKDKDGEDPFTRLEREKAERVKGNAKRHAKNVSETSTSAGGGAAAAIPATVKLSTKLDPASVRGQIAKGKALKQELKQASYFAGVSTASMGKFDTRLKGEGQNDRKLPGSRKKVLPVSGAAGEQEAAGKVLNKVVRKTEEGLVNVQRAVGNYEAEKSKRKKAGGDSDDEEGGRRKKGRVGKVKNRRVPKKPKASKLGPQKGGKSAGKKKKLQKG